jgi:transaldolase
MGPVRPLPKGGLCHGILVDMKPSFITSEIFLDSGDPNETRRALALLGFLDGQTTNPSLVAKNPHIVELKNAGALTEETIWQKYQEVASEIRTLIPHGSISAEVFSDATTTTDEMISKGRELSKWFSGIFVKLPTTRHGLAAAQVLSGEGINVNMTLCFSQEQAAAVHAATLGAKHGSVYISPFIGRLDDIGFHGLDLIKNIVLMYQLWDSHVMVLSASIRSLDHLFGSMLSGSDIITVPIGILEEWKNNYGLNKDPRDFSFPISEKTAIPFRELQLQDWQLYDVHHSLTDKGIEKFASDWESLFAKPE